MSFSGRVDRESHLGGLLVDFEGRPPRLGARIRISGGKILGRVDTVIGPIGSALIHVHPLYDGIDARASLGSPVEIAPRESGRQGRPKRRHSGGSYRDNKGGGNRGRGPGGQGRRNFRDNKGGGNRGRGPNKTGRKSGNSGRRRDSGKSGRGNRRR
jgi:rRNA processing protein Gar1